MLVIADLDIFNDLKLSNEFGFGLGGRFAAFQDGPWFQPGGMNSAVAPQQQQQLEALKSQEIASEWDRWRAHGARQDWLSGRQSSRHNVTTSDEPTSTTPDHNQAHVHFKQLLDHSCSSSNIQEKQQQYPQQRTWENEVPHRSSSWPAMFGAPDQHTAQVRILSHVLQVIVLKSRVHDN